MKLQENHESLGRFVIERLAWSNALMERKPANIFARPTGNQQTLINKNV
jgi:hypothetical protein